MILESCGISSSAMPVRVPTTVHALVMVSDDQGDFFVTSYFRKNPFADLRVLLHLAAFIEGQRPGLFKEAGWQSDLADVVDETG